MSVDNRGLFHKFRVKRVDGEDGPLGDHEGAEYFVLDLTYDDHALPAIVAYARSCRRDRPALSKDLLAKAHDMKEEYDEVQLTMALPMGYTHDGGPCFDDCPKCHPEAWKSQ